MTTNAVFAFFFVAIAALGTAFWRALAARHEQLQQQRIDPDEAHAFRGARVDAEMAREHRLAHTFGRLREQTRTALWRLAYFAKRTMERLRRIHWRRLLSSPGLGQSH